MRMRFSEEQIVKMIQEHKGGKSVIEISREYGVAEQTFYKWQQKYGDMKVSEVKKMKSLEEENAKLKRLVADVLNDIWTEEPFTFLQADNGPEFRSSAVQTWCKNHAVTQVFSRPGKPTDNCFIESFNRTFRDECLNENYFTSLSEAKEIIENRRIDYNENRPQKGLKELTPSQFKTKLKSMKNSP